MNNYDAAFRERLAHRLGEELESKAAALVDGYADTFEDYRHRCGEIRALKSVLRWCDEVEHAIQHDDRLS